MSDLSLFGGDEVTQDEIFEQIVIETCKFEIDGERDEKDGDDGKNSVETE